MAQSATALIGTSTLITEIDVKAVISAVISAVIIAGVLSLLTSTAGIPGLSDLYIYSKNVKNITKYITKCIVNF